MAIAFAGNALKAQIVSDLFASTEPVTVLDFGAGDGAGWAEQPLPSHISLIAYEPSPSRFKGLHANLANTARCLDAEAFRKADIQADVIVSFSVLQNLLDLDGYFQQARERIVPGGRFIVVYDDGFWRLSETLGHDVGPIVGLRQIAMNLMAPVFARIGDWERYRRRISQAQVPALAQRHGFRVTGERYGNLASMKKLCRYAPAESRDSFMVSWMELETRLNELPWPRGTGGYSNGLWAACGSRAVFMVAD